MTVLLLVVFAALAQQYSAAELALRTGKYDAAIAAFSRLAAATPPPPAAVEGLARALATVGRYDEAEAAARRSPATANTLGEILYLRGQVDEAERAFRQAITGKRPDSLTAELNLAILRWDRGERSAALRAFNRFIQVYDTSDRLSSDELTAVGIAYRYLGSESPQLFKDALTAFGEAAAADANNLEARVREGELFLEKYNSTDAQESFEAVLRVNPSYPRAMLGMAKSKHFDGDPQGFAMTEMALEVNPNLVEARVFLASQHLALEDYAEAAREAEAALRVNPVSPEALSVLAAARFLQHDPTAYQEARRRTLARNPTYADLDNTLADVATQNRLYPEAVDFARAAVSRDPRSWRAYGTLGMGLFRSGDIAGGRRNLETAFQGDPYNVWTKNTLDLLDKLKDFRETRTPRFLFVTHRKETDLLAPYLAELGELAYDRLAERYRYHPPAPIRLEVYPSHADFSVRTVGLTGLGALGVSFGPVLAMDSPSAREPGHFNWGSTFWHELTHAFTMGASGSWVPRWFSEGLSVLEERRAGRGWGDDVSLQFLIAYQQGRLLPLGRLNNGFVRPAFPEQVFFSYYQASLICELIEREVGIDGLLAILRGYREGLTTPEIFRRVLGTDLEGFEGRFDAYVRRRFGGPLAAIRPSSAAKSGDQPSAEALERRAREDTTDFLAQLAAGRELFGRRKHDQAVPYLERAKALFPEYAAEDSPYWLLAQIRTEKGLLRPAADELATLTAINENDYSANLAQADLLERLADSAGAALALERAVYIYPMDATLHARLARLYGAVGDRPQAIRERRAVLALDPVDRPEALYQLAAALFQAGDVAGARREVLRALEEAPSFEKAQELLLAIKRAK